MPASTHAAPKESGARRRSAVEKPPAWVGSESLCWLRRESTPIIASTRAATPIHAARPRVKTAPG
jgi:hypothetical protein